MAIAALAAAPGVARAQDDTASAARGAAADTPAERPGCDEGVALAPGVCLSGEALVDGFANVRGGVRSGVAALGQVKLGLRLDLGEVAGAGLDGWTFQATVFGIHGRQPTPTLIGGLAPLSNAEALSTVRLSELWLERDLGGAGSLRFGQLAADAEFFTAASAGNLTNGTFGWPLATSTALPSGGPAYPFAAPGVRLALGDPDEGSGVRLALFSGDPGGRYGDGTDPQRHNRTGTNFSFAGGALYIAEGVVGPEAPAKGEPRPWVAKLGGWYHTGGFDDARGDPALYRLDEPPSSGVVPGVGDDAGAAAPAAFARRRNNHGAYGIGEATLWRGAEAGSSVAAFARVSFTPGGRNLLDAYADGGVSWRGPFGRVGDTASLGVAYARAGETGRDLDRATARQTGARVPVRDREVVVEANYEFGVVPDRLFVRPLVQWISHPALGVPDERYRADERLRDAVVLGVRVRAVL